MMAEFTERYAADPLASRALSVMTGGVTRGTVHVSPAAPFAEEAAGCIIRDQLGHEVIDLCNNYTSLIHGHAHAPTVDAAVQAISAGSALSMRTASEVRLAEHLRDRTGQPHWRFSNSGTEAVMTAVRAARAFTGRDVLVKFTGSYHGTANDVVPAGAAGLPASRAADVIECAPGDIEAVRAVFAQHGRDVAAVLIDLMPNRAGLIPADPAYVAKLRELTRAHGALLIVDEVISLRIGRGGLAREYGAEPDLITAGKIIGGGFPIGAVGGRADVLDVFHPQRPGRVDWGGTFSANPVSMTAGLATLEHFDPAGQQRLDDTGDELRARLRAEGIDASGRGSLTRIVDQRFCEKVWWQLYASGLLLGTNGLICLSTPMTQRIVDTVATRVQSVFRSL